MCIICTHVYVGEVSCLYNISRTLFLHAHVIHQHYPPFSHNPQDHFRHSVQCASITITPCTVSSLSQFTIHSHLVAQPKLETIPYLTCHPSPLKRHGIVPHGCNTSLKEPINAPILLLNIYIYITIRLVSSLLYDC